jgi:hypothetical protein
MKPLAARLARLHVPTHIDSKSDYDEATQLWIAEGGVRAEPVSSTATAKTQIKTREDGSTTIILSYDTQMEGGW